MGDRQDVQTVKRPGKGKQGRMSMAQVISHQRSFSQRGLAMPHHAAVTRGGRRRTFVTWQSMLPSHLRLWGRQV